MKKNFDRLISRHNIALERLNELEYRARESPQTKIQRVEKQNPNRISKNCRTISISITYTVGIPKVN